MKKVAIYARVSTSDQTADMQIRGLREFAERRGLQIYKEYVDTVTGVMSKRTRGQGEAFKDLMKDARMRYFDVVLVWKFDRFARTLSDLIHGMQLFECLGIEFISATQEIDTTVPMGKLFFHMIGAFAEFERDLIVDRVKAGIGNARKKGVRLGRPKMSAPNEEQRILQLYQEGISMSAIAKLTGRSRAGVWLVVKRLLAKQKLDVPKLDLTEPPEGLFFDDRVGSANRSRPN